MTDAFKSVREGIFCFFLSSVLWSTVYCVEDSDQIVPRAKLGEPCWDMICEENLFCKQGLAYPVCKCRPGFRVYNNECVPSSGENEFCSKQEDCCGPLVCINGICRKPGPNSEFVTLAKICLGITVTTIIIAIFSSLIKCLVRYDNSRAFQRQSNTSSLNYLLPFRRPVLNSGPYVNPGMDVHEVRDEKPPSYEECVRATGGNTLPLDPPPYVISINPAASSTDINANFQSANCPSVRPENLATPLNVHGLSYNTNSNAISTQSTQKNHFDTTKNSSS